MNPQLIVKNSVKILAPASRVWKVLTIPEYIRQWDNLPDDFGDAPLNMLSKIEWPGTTSLTVTEFEPNQLLKLTLYSENWELPASNYDIAYSYRIVEEEDHVRLEIEIGDFAILSNGKDYFGNSVEFAASAMEKIKELVEGLG